MSSVEEDSVVKETLKLVKHFYDVEHPEIKESHGRKHVMAVYNHALQALHYETRSSLTVKDKREIVIATLLHDVDDNKYFPDHMDQSLNQNATSILSRVGVTFQAAERILMMINWVSCSKNGNTIPSEVQESDKYHMLIPRWCDRLEAVGKIGVYRCYQYTIESGGKLSSDESPRPKTEEEIWEKYATTERFENYQSRGGKSTDMISHYYDKLLHIAKPPPTEICNNRYIQTKAQEGLSPLIEVCLRYGQQTGGIVDVEYIKSLAPP